eukprot:2057180-Pyramimonas_sp.AAC.1
MQGGARKGRKRANLLGAHHSFGVLAVGSSTVSVRREGAYLELAVLMVGLPSLWEPGCFFPLCVVKT